MILSWAIAGAVALALVGCAVALVMAGQQRSSRMTRSYRRHDPADPRDPLHRHATHYLASGALPRWDP